MKPRLRPWALLAAAAALIALVAASCNERPGSGAQDARLDKVESSVSRVTGQADQVSQQILVLQKADEGMGADLAAIKASLEEIQQSLEAIRVDLGAVKTTNASLGRKLDDLDKKIAGVDQRLWLLEARYNDHLRKYHAGG